MSAYSTKSQLIDIVQDMALKISTKFTGKVDKVAGKQLSTEDYTTAEKEKLADLENYDDTEIQSAISGKVDKVTGKQLSTEDFTTAEKTKLADLENYDDTEIQTALAGKISSTEKGANNGVATLGNDGKVPSSQLPSYVDETVEGYLNTTDGKFYEDSSYTTEITPATSVIYVDLSTNKIYRWSGSQFTEISESLALGQTSSTAYPGDLGAQNASDISDLQSGKVDKVTGKQLSTEDFTTAEKTKLADLENYDDTAIQAEIDDKVDKVAGKGLSTNDYTTAEQQKLAGITDLSSTDVQDVKDSFSLT